MQHQQSARPQSETPREIIAGRNPVLALLEGERTVDTLYVASDAAGGTIAKIIAIASGKGVPIKRVDTRRLDMLCPDAAHQGVAAALSAHAYATVEDLFARAGDEPPFFVLVDGVEDPHNLGAIIRTAEVAGAHGLICPKRRNASLTPATAKAAAGALEHLPVARVTNLVQTIEELKQRGVWIYAADMGGPCYCEQRLDGPIALVIGSEGRGVSRLVRERCDGILSLPMYGTVTSLNASVAAGVLLYEITRQRHGISAVSGQKTRS